MKNPNSMTRRSNRYYPKESKITNKPTTFDPSPPSIVLGRNPSSLSSTEITRFEFLKTSLSQNILNTDQGPEADGKPW